MSNSGSGRAAQTETPPPRTIPEVSAEVEDDELTCTRTLALRKRPTDFPFGFAPTHVTIYYSRGGFDEPWFWDRAEVSEEQHRARAVVPYRRTEAPIWVADLADYHCPPER